MAMDKVVFVTITEKGIVFEGSFDGKLCYSLILLSLVSEVWEKIS